MVLSKTKKLLTKVCKKGIAWTHNQGYNWYSTKLLPAVFDAVNDDTISKELLSDTWYIIGDIHDFNDAPLKAIESYKNAIKLDPNIAAAYREIASMLSRMGKYKTALKYINISLKIEPNEKYAIDEKRDILGNIKFDNEPTYINGDILWEMNECIANQKFEYVINCLKKSKDLEKLKVLARAFGALDMNYEYIRIWNIIVSKNKKFELDYADWFYMPYKIYESSEIWYLFKKAVKYIKPSLFIQFNSLAKYYKELSYEVHLKAKCDYMIYTAKNDALKITKMRKKYPLWNELNRY